MEVYSSEQISKKMFEMVNKWYKDTSCLYPLSIYEVFNKVKVIPYNLESGLFQALSRPKFTLNGKAPFIACANKAIVLASYAKLLSIPFGFVLCKNDLSQDYYHVNNVFRLSGQKIYLDATYPEFYINKKVVFVDTLEVWR